MRSGKAPKTVDEYLAIVPEPARSTLVKVRATIRATRGHREHQLWHAHVQVQRPAGGVRGILEALQSVSWCGADRGAEGRIERLPYI